MWKVLLDRALQLQQDLCRSTKLYDQIMVLVLMVNTATQVVMTFEGLAPAWVYEALEAVFLAFYMIECVLKLITSGLEYFKSLWNILDFSVTLVGLVDLFLDSEYYDTGRFTTFFHLLKMFKVCRAFRILRTLRFFSGPKVVMKVIGKSLKMNGVIFLLMFCMFVTFAIVLRQNFSKSDPKRFGSTLNTMSTLLQLLTLDDWISVYYTSRNYGAPNIIIFIVLYILIEYYIILRKNIRMEHCLRLLEALEKNQQSLQIQTNYLYRLIESTEGPFFYRRKEADEDEDELQDSQ
ncbi:cation channel sperm-associated 1 [Labeo rohita]|uniref:Cation channel sperm-associated 1 n=2 Tax=Labeonini TaxID=2743697 RepID=A0A498NE65_LABRO|nr:cation channel sperm-associated 1 [Labeo rohita]